MALAGEGDRGNDMASRRQSKFLAHDVVRQVIDGKVESGHLSGIPKSMGDVLKNADLRFKFRVYLKARHAEENLLFYESVELFQKVGDVGGQDKWRHRAAEGLMAKFVLENSVYEINVSAPTRLKLLRTTKWEKTSFDTAKSETYDLLKENYFTSFVAKEFLGDSS